MTDEELHRHLCGRQGSRADLATPALIVDLDALDRNIARMAEHARRAQVRLRPHAKTHKSAAIARRQLAAGAIGICCAKIGEAESLADGGVTRGLHLTSPAVSASAIARLVALHGRTDGMMGVVDHPDNVVALGTAMGPADQPLSVLIDIDPGSHRTGVASAEAAVALLGAVRAEPGLRYRGVQFYCGAEQHIEGFAARRAAMKAHGDYLRRVVAALAGAGGAPEIVTGGGTGTCFIDPGLGLFTELQVGSYVFMDGEYLACDLTGDGGGSPFETSLMVDARVVSANTPGMVTIDAGTKAFSTDAGAPTVLRGAPAGATYRFMGDEHGALLLGAGETLPLGGMVTLATPHCDPTVNLYDTYHVVQGETLRDLWPVAGRGRSR